jgi:hypothetical protein
VSRPFLAGAAASLLLLAACAHPFPDGTKQVGEGSASLGTRSWTLMVYMCGDNDLEAAMLADINEMEAADLSADCAVIVLADRGPGYDSTDGDWTDTRLFKIERDPSGLDNTIKSRRVSSSRLGLAADSNTELDMSSSTVLANFIESAEEDYPASSYALVLWGHGTGWRSVGCRKEHGGGWKGAIADDTSAGSLHTKGIGDAISGKGLSVVGMDLCFGALMEIAYQIRDDARYLVASEDAVPSSGWDYRDVLNRFCAGSERTQAALIDSIVDSFASQYRSCTGTTISCTELAKIDALNSALNAFCEKMVSCIDSSEKRDAVYASLVNDTEDFYSSVGPCDLFIDMRDMAGVLSAANDYADGEAAALMAAFDAAILRSWHCGSGNARANGLAMHLAPLDASLNLMTLHDPAYFKNAVVADPLDFVRDSSWVPCLPMGNGFLDILWYMSF